MSVNIYSNIIKESTIYIGIDVHKQILYCTFIDGEVTYSKSFQNFYSLKLYINKRYKGRKMEACYEAGYFGYSLYHNLKSIGVETIVVNPADIPTTDKDRQNKTDKRDSKKLAESLKSGLLTGIYIPSDQELGDRYILRLRSDAVKQLIKIKCKIKGMLDFIGIEYPERFANGKSHWSLNFIDWLSNLKMSVSEYRLALDLRLQELEFYKNHIKLIEKNLSELMERDRHTTKYDLLISVPGIGKVTATTFLLEVPNIERFANKDQFMSYLGLIPIERSSGENQRTGNMTRRCNKYLRSIFVEAAWIAIKHDQELTAYYNKARSRMSPQRSIILVAKKLARKIRYLLLNEQEYICQYNESLDKKLVLVKD